MSWGYQYCLDIFLEELYVGAFCRQKGMNNFPVMLCPPMNQQMLMFFLSLSSRKPLITVGTLITTHAYSDWCSKFSILLDELS